MLLPKAKSLPARSWVLVAAATTFAIALASPGAIPLAAPFLSELPRADGGAALPPTSPGPVLPRPETRALNDPNGSPFLAVEGPESTYGVDNSLLPEEYADPSGSGWVDSYVLQTVPLVSNDRVLLQVQEGGNYSTAIDSVALGLTVPGGAGVYTEPNDDAVLDVASTLTVVAAHDGNGVNVTTLLSDPGANASSSVGSYYVGSSGDVVVGGFGSVPQANQDVLLLRTAQDPGFPPSGSSGVTVEVQDPSTGLYSTVGFVPSREMWATEALPLGNVLGSGTQPVVVRLVWSGTHALAWLALGEGVSNAVLTPATLVSAAGPQGANWTSLLAVTDGVDAYFLPGDVATLTFGLPYAPSPGTQFVVITDGAPWTTPAGSPHAQFSYAPSVPVARRAVSFTSTSWDNSSAIVAYNWSFGDGAFSSGSSPAHSYASAGLYNVTLNITDALGVNASVTEKVLIYPLWDWQSPHPTWNAGNLCSPQVKSGVVACQSSRYGHCPPALQYNFSGNGTVYEIGVTGSQTCLVLNFEGSRDTVYLNLSGSNWQYLEVALAGPLNSVHLSLSGSSITGTIVLYGAQDSYSLSSTGSGNQIQTFLVSADLAADAAPAGHDAQSDGVSLLATGSQDTQNVTWVSFPGNVSAPHATGLPGSGRGNRAEWANISLFPAAWASPLNESGCGPRSGWECCSSMAAPDRHCCGWGLSPDARCCGGGWWSASPDHCCPWDASATPDRWCWSASGASTPRLVSGAHGTEVGIHSPVKAPPAGAPASEVRPAAAAVRYLAPRQ